MRDLLFVLGALLAAEGLTLALAPGSVRRALELLAEAPEDRVRVLGLGAAAAGVAILLAVA